MSTWIRRRTRALVVTAMIVVMSVALVAVACGDDDDDNGTATKTATAAASPAAGGAAAATTIKVVMKDNSFDPKAINVPVGKEVTFEIDNQGKAIHNMSVKIDSKETVSKPDTMKAGEKGTLKATFAKAGTFDFKCDFHPTEMTGKITAK